MDGLEEAFPNQLWGIIGIHEVTSNILAVCHRKKIMQFFISSNSLCTIAILKRKGWLMYLKNHQLGRGLNQPNWKNMLVKMDHLPSAADVNIKKHLWNHHLARVFVNVKGFFYLETSKKVGLIQNTKTLRICQTHTLTPVLSCLNNLVHWDSGWIIPLGILGLPESYWPWAPPPTCPSYYVVLLKKLRPRKRTPKQHTFFFGGKYLYYMYLGCFKHGKNWGVKYVLTVINY